MAIIDIRADRPYQVHIADGAISRLPLLLEGALRVAVIHPPGMDVLAERVGDLLGEWQVVDIEVPDAEEAKSPAVLAACWDVLAEAGFTRSDAIIGLGGGATTDLAGFVAATWLRGVRFVGVPTTVLGMVDAAIGGKTGINTTAGKNLVGAFYEPAGVLCDLSVLDTLPVAEIASGLAEVVKGGFIADPAILDIIAADPTAAVTPGSEALAELITRKIQVKADVVSGDFRESTAVGAKIGRELLNYGHTLAHAIERREKYRWRHGDAVAVGMVYTAELARVAGLLDADVVTRHRDVLTSLGLPTTYRGGVWEQLRDAMALDKKTRGSCLRLVVLHDIAQATMLEGPDEQLLVDAYDAITA